MTPRKKTPCRLFSITQTHEFVRERGVRYSRPSIERLCLLGRLGQKVGSQWVITESEAEALVETLRAKGY
jgi:hypothetical protein